MVDLSKADPVAQILAWLRTHPWVLADFGGPAHVSGLVEAPWPHLRVIPAPGGDLGELVWSTSGEVQLEAIGHPDGRPGEAELRRMLVRAAQAAVEIVERDAAPADVVVERVTVRSVIHSPLPNDQPRVLTTMLVKLHPPIA